MEAITDYAIYMLDEHGIVTSWNPGARRFKGYEADQIIGQHFSRFYTEEDRGAGLPDKTLEVAAHGRFEGEGWRVRKDGSQFWVHVVIDPIRETDGTLIGFAKITRDLTERREAQAALERARVGLAQSQKMEAIGQLTGGVAHDFNNLLMAVMSGLELIRRKIPEDAKLKFLLNNALEAARRGVSLTQRMLSIARRQEMTLRAVNTSALIAGMSDLLARTLGPNVTIETAIPPELPSVKADTNQLETAILNLVINARDSMSHGGVIKIMAHTAKCDEAMPFRAATEHCVVLSIIDTGIGMDDNTLARAMEPFFTTKGVGKGTGLGLSIVHGMAEQLGGSLRIQSQVGQGTKVELWLPTCEGEALVEAVLAQPAFSEGTSASLVTLVVDDDELVLANISAMLGELGHTVIEASSGAQALELMFKTHRIDLVVTDYAMPHMTGMQLATAIKAEWPKIPILLVSGYVELLSDVLDIPKLAKPFSLTDLETAVADVCSGAKTNSEKFRSSYLA